jgi:2-polyprenyl-3-methyl-5-hydroxy-6-metoxy-1,4-benzoquinol methylase
MVKTEADFWEENAESWARTIAEQAIESRKLTNAAILESISKDSPRSVLDVGCGEGWLTAELIERGMPCLGVDGSETLITIARKKHGPYFETASYEQITSGAWKPTGRANPFFEAAVFNFSLFGEDLSPLLRAVAKLLLPRGKIYIQTLHVHGPDEWRTEDFKTLKIPFQGGLRWYARTSSSWLKLFSESGLKVSRTQSARPAAAQYEPGVESMDDSGLGTDSVGIIYVLTQEAL